MGTNMISNWDMAEAAALFISLSAEFQEHTLCFIGKNDPLFAEFLKAARERYSKKKASAR